MADLRTDYKDDLLDTSVNTQRKYRQVDNGDGTVSFVDETVYAQNGDTFGASEVNQIHAAVNLVNDSLTVDTTNLSEDFSLNGLLQMLAEQYFPNGFNLNAQPASYFTSVSNATVNPMVFTPTATENAGIGIENYNVADYNTLTITATATNGVLTVWFNDGSSNQLLTEVDGVISNTTKTFNIDLSRFTVGKLSITAMYNTGTIYIDKCILH